MPGLSTPPVETPIVGQGGFLNRAWTRWLSDAWRTIVPRRQIYFPTSSGVPTFTPEARDDFVAMCYDTANNHLYAYNGSWKKVLLS